MHKEKQSNSDTMKLAVSVIFAIILWYYVVTDQNPLITRSYDVPIRLLNMDYVEKNELVLMQNPNSLKVTIKLKGYKDDLEAVSGNQITASADLMGIKTKGEVRTNISVSGIPSGINLVEQSADELILNLDRKVTGELPIIYKYKGKLGDGYAPVMNSIEPAVISVSGPETMLLKAKTAVVIVDVNGLNGDITREQPVQILDNEGKELLELAAAPKVVKVSVSFGVIKLVPILPQISGKPAEGYSVLESGVYPKFISIAGKGDALAGINEIKTEKISIKGISERLEKEVRMILPPGTALVEDDVEVKAFVDVEKVVTKEIRSGIEVRNLAEGLSIEGISQEILLTVVGPESMLENPAIPLKVYVDMGGLGEGEHVLSVKWDTHKEFKIMKSLPETITLKAKKIM